MSMVDGRWSLVVDLCRYFTLPRLLRLTPPLALFPCVSFSVCYVVCVPCIYEFREGGASDMNIVAYTREGED